MRKLGRGRSRTGSAGATATSLAGLGTFSRFCSCSFLGTITGARITVGIPSATFELERTHGHQFFHRGLTFRTIGERFIGNFLLDFKDLVTLLTLVLIHWHFHSPIALQIIAS